MITDGEVSNWSSVTGSAVQGAITGGAAGLTGGVSLLVTTTTLGAANAVGGALNREIQGQETTVTDVVTDAAVGAALGCAGKMIGTIKGSPKNTVNEVKQIGPSGDASGSVTKQIPKDWTSKTTGNKQGTIFKDPKNPSGNNVRVQSGNPSSPNPSQQKPYVKEVKDGKVVDKQGKQVDSNSPESHIPKEEWKLKK